MKVRAARGAIVVSEDTAASMHASTERLLASLLARNGVVHDDLISILFTAERSRIHSSRADAETLSRCRPRRAQTRPARALADMTLQMWVDLAQIVSASAVTLTLLAVIMTIRQNTRSQKAVAVDSLAAAITSINVPAMKSHILGSALSKATADWGSASREERIIAHFFLFSFFKLLENAWYQRRAGILDQAQWIGWETLLRKYYHADGVRRVWWPGRKDAYSRNFKSFFREQNRLMNLAV